LLVTVTDLADRVPTRSLTRFVIEIGGTGDRLTFVAAPA
jgi:hypothetical protein